MEIATSTSAHQKAFSQLQHYLNQHILGQEKLIMRLLITLLADGHLLVEGAPGLAKTTAIKTLAAGLEADFHRIQFTPDLLPADLTGTDIFSPHDASFSFQKGPLFHNIILADEINRAPAKVQSALLEAMGEQQISIGNHTYALPSLFLVMATQNPIEQEGTYPLPEAQLDRFLMYTHIGYPESNVEQKILHLNRHHYLTGKTTPQKKLKPLSQSLIMSARRSLLELHMNPMLEEYLVHLVMATRNPKVYGDDLVQWLRFGASPRGTIALDRCSRAHAWLKGRDYVTPEDIHAVAHDVLRHRILLSFEAEASGITPDHFIDELLNRIAIP
ncbi:MAG: AAA family ATPase [Gammaproteobacteria bacterium]